MRKQNSKAAEAKTAKSNKKNTSVKKKPGKAKSEESPKKDSYSEEKAFVLWTTLLNNSLG